MRPVVVCGLPRSGTSLVRELLNAHKRIVILDEFPMGRMPSLMALAGELESLLQDPLESWRGQAELRFQWRLAWLVSSVWPSASRPKVLFRFLESSARRFGVKTPSAEGNYRELAKLFGPFLPQYVYCMRDPGGIYESLLSVPWGGHYQPEAVLAMLEASWKAVQAIEKEGFGTVFIFDLRQAQGELKTRLRMVARLFAFLGVPLSLGVLRFCWLWPGINRRKGDELLPLEEKRRRLASFSQLLAICDPSLLSFFKINRGQHLRPKQKTSGDQSW
ncbi:MAG: sulfotransferase [Thermoanaerobaculaceae bacterium]